MAQAGEDGTVGTRAPAVVNVVAGGSATVAVVAVVGNLVEEESVGRIHLHHPLQAPARLVQDVRDAVGAGHAGGVVAVAPDGGVLAVGE